MLLAPAGAGGGAGGAGGGGLGGPTGLPRWLWFCIAATVITLQVLILGKDRAILERNCGTAGVQFAEKHSSAMVVHDAAAAAAASGHVAGLFPSETALREWAVSHGLVVDAAAAPAPSASVELEAGKEEQSPAKHPVRIDADASAHSHQHDGFANVVRL